MVLSAFTEIHTFTNSINRLTVYVIAIIISSTKHKILIQFNYRVTVSKHSMIHPMYQRLFRTSPLREKALW